MSDQPSTDALNRLLAAEHAGLIPRLAEAAPSVTRSAASDRAVLGRIIEASTAHRRGLVELILQMRGSPVTPRRSTTSSDMHYVELSHLLPRLVADVRGLVETYEAAGVCGNAEADALLARILADHRRHLGELEELQATASGNPSEPRP